MGKNEKISTDFAHLARLAINGSKDDVVLFVRRIARRIQDEQPELSAELQKLAQAEATRGSVVRDAIAFPPVDADSRLQLVRSEFPVSIREPIWPSRVKATLIQIVEDRQRAAELTDAGLMPTRSALFVGPPGVGKTLSARWLAMSLGLPLLTLDLSAVMSSFLGRTGGNLRNVTDYARGTPSVLLLDEFDAIAKRRDDATEIGELKRLVTVLLQEIESWPSEGFLIAASNHAELLDPAVWRRFDTVVEFDLPDAAAVEKAIHQRLPDAEKGDQFVAALSKALIGMSFSEIEREINHAKRRSLIQREPVVKCLSEIMRSKIAELPKKQQIKVAVSIRKSGMSQYDTERLTGVSRPTIRAHEGDEDEVA